ncbi:MAG: hypothetical protein IPF38_17520 [Burkholderiales bacterium]|nr:hypothetical protein [Burkholderiales bacterium]
MNRRTMKQATITHLLRLALVALGLATVLAQAHEGPMAVPDAKAAAAKPARKPRAQLAVGTAFAPDGTLWLVGLNADNQLFVQTTTTTTATAPSTRAPRWSAPRVLDTTGDAVSADGENHPKLAFGPKGYAVISYTQPGAKPYTGMIRMLRSTNGGKTFSQPFTVHADRQEITHRFESIAFDAQGVLHTLWLDKRDLETAPRGANGKPDYRGAAVYRNTSVDGGATFGPDIKLADHSCECCRIALAQGQDGHVRALWRHVFEPNVRDHAFASLDADAPQMPQLVRATFDDWHIDACPHHGPGLAAAAGGGFHAVWFGARQEGGQAVSAVRYGRLLADGSPDEKTVRRLPDERAEHADVAAQGARVAVVWRSTDGMTSTLKVWLSADGGQHFHVKTLAQAQGDNDHPRLAQQGGRLVVVWRTAKEVQLHDIPW